MITLVTGGAKSGKTSFAESRFREKDDVVYIATAENNDDSEMKNRIDLHKASRPKSWRTFEGSYAIVDAIGEENYYILDCITVLASNIMFDMSKDINVINADLQKDIEDKIVGIIQNLVDKINKKDKELIMVTNEVGCSIVPENHVARVYRDIAGRVNQKIAIMADEVYAVFCGIPLKLK